MVRKLLVGNVTGHIFAVVAVVVGVVAAAAAAVVTLLLCHSCCDAVVVAPKASWRSARTPGERHGEHDACGAGAAAVA